MEKVLQQFWNFMKKIDLKTFKNITDEIFKIEGFSKKKNHYYLFFNEISIAINLQKSNYSDGYYINIGYLINSLHSSPDELRAVNGDVRARFEFEIDGKKSDFFELNNYFENEQNRIKIIIMENIKNYTETVNSIDSLKLLIIKKPVLIYQTTLKAKIILGLEK